GDVGTTEDLPDAGHPRSQCQPLPRPRLDERVFVEYERPRADERHLSLEHVDELRELVDRVPSKEAADSCDPWIPRDLEHPRVASCMLVQRRERGLLRVRVPDHRAELVDEEHPVARSHSALPEEDWHFRVELDGDRDE